MRKIGYSSDNILMFHVNGFLCVEGFLQRGWVPIGVLSLMSDVGLHVSFRMCDYY
jgi:hypothetical protein